MKSTVLDVVGLVSVSLGAFLVALWLGFVVFGALCVLLSWRMST